MVWSQPVGSPYELVVLRMRSDPEPMDAIRHRRAQRPVIEANPDAIKTSVPDDLEMKRTMRGVGLEKRIVAPRQRLNFRGERFKALPEAV